MRLLSVAVWALLTLAGSAVSAAEAWRAAPGTYAVIDTTLGRIVCRLFTDQAPKTAANFIGLAEGSKEFVDAKTRQRGKRPFYDGLTFHRVIPGFMIQGGDPLGNGFGGPGYEFADEFHPLLAFNRQGLLAMANSGPNTNGSQFFITVAPARGLDRLHSIFGEVVDGENVVVNITRTPRDSDNRPRIPVVMNKVEIVRVGR